MFQPDELEGITATHPSWIGNWWIGYLLTTAVLLFSGIMLLGFPRELPGTADRKRQRVLNGELRPARKTMDGGFKGMFLVIKELLLNPTYACQTLGKLFV